MKRTKSQNLIDELINALPAIRLDCAHRDDDSAELITQPHTYTQEEPTNWPTTNRIKRRGKLCAKRRLLHAPTKDCRRRTLLCMCNHHMVNTSCIDTIIIIIRLWLESHAKTTEKKLMQTMKDNRFICGHIWFVAQDDRQGRIATCGVVVRFALCGFFKAIYLKDRRINKWVKVEVVKLWWQAKLPRRLSPN